MFRATWNRSKQTRRFGGRSKGQIAKYTELLKIKEWLVGRNFGFVALMGGLLLTVFDAYSENFYKNFIDV
jgi:hypothetical protein